MRMRMLIITVNGGNLYIIRAREVTEYEGASFPARPFFISPRSSLRYGVMAYILFSDVNRLVYGFAG